MKNTFHLDFLESDGVFYQGECRSIIFPTMDGFMGIQSNHYDMIAAILPGDVKYTLPDGIVKHAAVSNGFIKSENGIVTLLVDSAERPEEIDINRAKKAIIHAKEDILQKKSIESYYIAQLQMARAMNRIRVKKRYDTKK